MSQRGTILAFLGEAAEALPLLRDALRMMHEENEIRHAAAALPGLAKAAALVGDMKRAVILYAAGEPQLAGEVALFEHIKVQASRALGPGEFEAYWAAGKAMSLEQAVAYALEEPEPVGG